MTDDAHQDPLNQFKSWYEEAKRANDPALDAMTLATATRNGIPSARVVLYKGIDQDGFMIYTNYRSRKAREIEENSVASLVFYWPTLYKQVRIEGKLTPLSKEESLHYFHSRPRESRISAWVSEQSIEIPDREYLLTRYQHYHELFKDTSDIPLPEYWGGFRLLPHRIEFWTGREHRLHDRLCYVKQATGWNRIRLAP